MPTVVLCVRRMSQDLERGRSRSRFQGFGVNDRRFGDLERDKFWGRGFDGLGRPFDMLLTIRW